MFATLDLRVGRKTRDQGDDTSQAPAIPKRRQVRRACDWCKLMRIKCDNDWPCYNCTKAHRDCGRNRQNEFRSLAAAVREVEALRAQLRGLLDKEEEESEVQKGQGALTTPPSSASPSVSWMSSDDFFAGDSRVADHALSPEPTITMFGSMSSVGNDSLFRGTALMPLFLSRFNQYLQTARPRLNIDILSTSGISPNVTTGLPSQAFLPPDHEAQALDLFWRSHYFSFPILNECRFRKEYRVLLAETPPGEARKPSPLVDIILALCIQLGCYSDDQPGSCPALGGFQYYRRCQEALDDMIENPTIVTVQCYVFSTVYFYEAGLLNRAYTLISKAMSTATMLGLPLQASHAVESEYDGELLRRTSWAIYAIDAQISMETGRPPIISTPESPMTCPLPSDSPGFAQWLAPHYQHDPASPSWLGFQTQTLRLLLAVKAARSAFEARYSHVTYEAGYDVFLSRGAAREECARCLAEHVKEIDKWTKQVPKEYSVPRQLGQPFSTDRSILNLSPNPNILIHWQRQSLLLEIQYHHQCINLYQPFICFTSPSDLSTPIADGNATAGLYHAMALTNMMHQALTTSEALGGTYHVFRLLKTALYTMIGYVYTFPLCHERASIQKSIDMAISIIDMYRPIVAEAAPVGQLAKILANDVNSVIKIFHTGSSWSPASSASPASSTSAMLVAPISNDTPLADPSFASRTQMPLPSGTKELNTSMVAPTVPSPAQSGNRLLDFGSLNETTLQMLQGQDGGWDDIDMLWASIDTVDHISADIWATLGDIIQQ